MTFFPEAPTEPNISSCQGQHVLAPVNADEAKRRDAATTFTVAYPSRQPRSTTVEPGTGSRQNVLLELRDLRSRRKRRWWPAQNRDRCLWHPRPVLLHFSDTSDRNLYSCHLLARAPTVHRSVLSAPLASNCLTCALRLKRSPSKSSRQHQHRDKLNRAAPRPGALSTSARRQAAGGDFAKVTR